MQRWENLLLWKQCKDEGEFTTLDDIVKALTKTFSFILTAIMVLTLHTFALPNISHLHQLVAHTFLLCHT